MPTRLRPITQPLKDLPPTSVAKEPIDESDLAEKNELSNNRKLLDQKTSNLSNLQIVKKYGRLHRIGKKLYGKIIRAAYDFEGSSKSF